MRMHVVALLLLIFAPPDPNVWKLEDGKLVSELGFLMPAPPAVAPPVLSPPISEVLPCVVLLIEFPDLKLEAQGLEDGEDLEDYFFTMFFSETTAPYYPFPSFRNFWLENSYGMFDVQGDVFGVYLADHNKDCYGNGECNRYPYCGIGGGAKALVSEAVKKADPEVDFSKYAKDGVVKCLIVVHAGRGGEESGYSYKNEACSDIWSHYGHMSLSVDGVRISSYIVVGGPVQEICRNNKDDDGDGLVDERSDCGYYEYGNMGVVAHEFGHSMGLTDIYDVDWSSCGVGPYSLMAYGCHGPDPNHLSPWEKIYLGWAYPKVVTGFKCVQLGASETIPDFLKLWKGGKIENEYFLVENRSKIGFDRDLPADGILIWYVDEDVIGQEGNRNECTSPPCEKHYGIALVQKDCEFELERNKPEEGQDCRYNVQEIEDYFVKGDIFPQCASYEVSWSGEPHEVMIAVGSREFYTQRLGVSTSKDVLPMPPDTTEDITKHDFVEPGKLYMAPFEVTGTLPIKAELLEPKTAYLVYEGRSTDYIVFEEYGKAAVAWKAPYGKGKVNFKLKLSNCISDVTKNWNVSVLSQQISEVSEGCACSVTHPFLLALLMWRMFRRSN